MNNILLIGMTNRIDMIDEALLRPGRMEVKLEIGLPDENGNICNIPSYALKVGDQISVRERSKSMEAITASLSSNPSQMEWLEWNGETQLGKVIAAPERIQIPENIKEQLIVELYSK